MQTRRIKLRFRRRFRKGQKQVGDLSTQAEQQIDTHLFKRFGRLSGVRRFILAWLGLMLLLMGGVVVQNLALSNYYQALRTVPGGIYNEGVEGRFTNANPLFATSNADNTVSRLVFAGLLKYGSDGKLAGDLAKDYQVDERGITYTVHLKKGLKWQDGQPLTSADVLYTYQMIQNPDVRSPLQGGWQGIKVSAPDAGTVVFELPGPLAAFPNNMTNGIVPKHLLDKIPPADLRSADFNTVHPVGAGPFAWQAVAVKGDSDPRHAQQQIALKAFADYQGGQPKLQKFIVHVYADEAELTKAFESNQLTAAEGLNSIPPELVNNDGVQQHNLPLRAANMVFFKTTSGVLADQAVRQALVRSANVPSIVAKLGYPARLVREPILLGQVAYDKSLAQPGFDLNAAKTLLDNAGWTASKEGVRSKAGQPLAFVLTAPDTQEARFVAKQLQAQWRGLGAKVTVLFLRTSDFQNALTYHSYDAILNGISIGDDPDVFVYWDSSQADIRSANRLNLSEYKNPTADSSLEAGRTRSEPKLRVIKYKPFLEEWQKDAPALGLYQPRVIYLTNGFVNGLSDQPINTATDRFDNVQNWQIREAKVTN